MNYNTLIKTVAKEYNTTPQEVEAEMEKAIKEAGYDIPVQLFIALVINQIIDDIS